MKKYFENTYISKIKSNKYFQDNINDNIIFSLLSDDVRLKDLIIKVKSKDYQNLYQSRKKVLMKKFCDNECKKRCCYFTPLHI
jgi:hypothetical protein